MRLPFLPQSPWPVADAHVHIFGESEAEDLLESSARLGVTRVFASCLGPPPLKFDPTAQDTRDFNRLTTRVVGRHPMAVVGCAYVNPCHGREELTEFRACVEDLGLRGLKFWMACYCDDPRVYPLVEQAILYRVPILIHTYSIVGGSKPNESEATHVARLASRYPEARILMAHMSGNWPVALKAIRAHRSVHVDPSGTDPEDGQVAAAVAELGPERVLFGSDAPIRDVSSMLAKIYGAAISDEAKRLVLCGNFERLIGGGS
jgi:predicted TIM-barrel fold metal-dependent hydrolase